MATAQKCHLKWINILKKLHRFWIGAFGIFLPASKIHLNLSVATRSFCSYAKKKSKLSDLAGSPGDKVRMLQQDSESLYTKKNVKFNQNI